MLHPNSHRPPLYTWFPYNPKQCSGYPNGNCVVVVVQQVAAPTPPANPPSESQLPAPVMPKSVKMDRPFIPGSSVAMGEPRFPQAVPPMIPPAPPIPKPPTPIAIGYNPIRMPMPATPNYLPLANPQPGNSDN